MRFKQGNCTSLAEFLLRVAHETQRSAPGQARSRRPPSGPATQYAASGTRDMSISIQTVTDAANQTGTATSQMLASSNSLSAEALALRQEVEQFLSTIRTL